jgi:hypothetical protein
MRTIILISAISLFYTCGKPEVKITTIPQEVKTLFAPAKKGSYYIFEDSVSKAQDSVYISSYFEGTDYTQNCKNNFNPQVIINTYKSTLNDSKYTWNVQMKSDCIDSVINVDFYRNVGGTPTLLYTKSKGFYFKDSTIPKINNMNVNGVDYKSVYYINTGEFYWAEDIGIIKFNQDRLGTINGVTYFAEVWKLKRKLIIK